jgi:phage tail protein X
MKALLVALSAALAITACGSAAGAGPDPTPSTGPGLGFDVVVSEQDHVATLHVGQTLEVVLHANSGMANWTPPRSSNEGILVPVVNPAATAVRGVTLASFQALAPGEAEITSNASPNCSPGQACPMYIAVYSVKVTVTA